MSLEALDRHASSGPSTPAGTAAIAVLDVRKRYGGVEALRGVSLYVQPGEILGLVGHNGAGKSTLVRIMQGDTAADHGEIRMGGKPVHFLSITDALTKGVGVVRQELELVPDLSVTNNIFLGDERSFSRFGIVNQASMQTAALPLLKKVGLNIGADVTVGTLSIGDQQLVAAARALRRAAKVLILDEPTSSLSPHEAGRLFVQIREMAAAGVAIIYISHRLDEVTGICDRVVVFRDGAVAGEFSAPADQLSAIVDCLAPNSGLLQVRQRAVPGDVLLKVDGLSSGRHGPASFTLRRGQIVGLFGLVGAGRTTIARAIIGDIPRSAGSVTLGGANLHPGSPAAAFDARIAYLSENRKKESIFSGRSIVENIGVRAPEDTVLHGFVRPRRMEMLARRVVEQLAIRTPGTATAIEMLSGGNQQKAVLGRLIVDELDILLLDEPTHGIDINAKRDLINALEALAQQGKGVLFISSELPELMSAADRILVMRQGRIVADLDPQTTSERKILGIASGEGETR